MKRDLCRFVSLDGQWMLEGLDIGQGLAREAFRPGYRPEDAFPGRVPGIVQAALLEVGRIEDPYWEMNNEKILWVEQKEWWYFKRFDIPSGEDATLRDGEDATLRDGEDATLRDGEDATLREQPGTPQPGAPQPGAPQPGTPGLTYELVFEGLTYHADVWLNGVALGSYSGMFLRRFLDISALVRPGSSCLLAMRLRALDNTWEDRPGGKLPRGTVRSSGVVAPFSYWWNWSPHLVPIGIWKSVYLKISGGIALRDPCVQTRIFWDECGEAEAADLELSFDLVSRRGREERITLQGRIQAVDVPEQALEFSRTLDLRPCESRRESLPLRLQRPRLWWPNGMGEHPLYRLSLEVLDRQGNCCDRAETEFGVRELELERNPDDLWVQETSTQSNRLWSLVGNPYPWTFVVNRKKLFIRGTNWVPADNLFRFTEERYQTFLDLAEEANFNMLRVWGGGIHETETFYRLCDRRGLLTWTEFWLSCANYPDMPRDLFVENAVDMVKVIRNHPCVALYCGGNEFNADDPDNRVLVDRLAQVVGEHDPQRRFRRGSPYKGDRHGGLLMLPTRTSNKYNGDILNGEQRLVLFRSEVAVARSAPVLESLRRFIAAEHLWPIDRPVWQYHHAVIKEQERDAREYGGTDSLERWIMSGQIVHSHVHRHNLEYCRQSKFRCSGCLQWQMNSSWPALHREIVDWWGLPKPAYYACKRSCRDYLVTADLEKYVYDGNEELRLGIWAVSDRQRRTGTCSVRAAVYNSHMGLLHRQEGEVRLGENESVQAFTLSWRVPGEYLRRVFFIHLNLEKDGVRLADNLYWCGTSGYTRKERCLEMNGAWKLQVGTEVRETKWQECLLPGYWALPPRAPEPGQAVFYRKELSIPADWQGTELELFCQGFEGNDRVSFNGTPIGQTEEELTVEIGTDEFLFTEKYAERLAAESGRAATRVETEPVRPGAGGKGERHNIRISSDPFVVPNLIKRFYRVPAQAVNWGGKNLLEVSLYGEHATGISEPVFIRAASSEGEKKAIRALDDRGDYLAEMSRLPQVRLEASLHCDQPLLPGAQARTLLLARVKNDSPHLAFFTALRLLGREGAGLEEAARLLYSDNYTHLLPGETREIRITVIHRGCYRGSLPVHLELGGWNVAGLASPQEVELRFE